MLTLTQRVAQIGPSINTRTEKHGEDNVAALDIPVTFLIDAQELCVIAKSPEAAHRLFHVERGKHLDQSTAALPGFKALALTEKVESCTVRLGLGDLELTLPDATLAKVKVTPKFGGKSEVDATIQTAPDFDEGILALFEHMGGECQFSCVCEGWDAQGNLPLGGES